MATVSPLECLFLAAEHRGWAVGLVSSARGESRDKAARLEYLELRGDHDPDDAGLFWARRDLVARLSLETTSVDAAATWLLEWIATNFENA